MAPSAIAAGGHVSLVCPKRAYAQDDASTGGVHGIGDSLPASHLFG
ncbi:NADH:flavin oxidoreductase, Old Yellow Enzyme family (plasmid) [Cupriavidus necator H850]|nr:NADH:flavin oxidoreductase, Old Yellow Enzyme family [Cupriavidus necator H850]